MTKIPFILSLIVAVMGSPALAQTDMPEDVATVKPVPGVPPVLKADTETGLWLLVQQSGQIAGTKYTMPGKVATLSYQRYLNSFKYPIPRQFNFGTGSAAGTGMGAGAGAGTGVGSGTSPVR